MAEGGTAWLGACVAVGAYMVEWGVCMELELYSWQAGGTQPTGMLTCFILFSEEIF